MEPDNDLQVWAFTSMLVLFTGATAVAVVGSVATLLWS